MDLPSTLPSIEIRDLTRTDANWLLGCTPDEKGGRTGGTWGRINRLARDMQPPDGSPSRWMLGPDAIWLLADNSGRAVLANGRDRLAAFLETDRRKLQTLLLVSDGSRVQLADALAVVDQSRNVEWHHYVAMRGVDNATYSAGIARSLHLLSTHGDDCLHPSHGGYSNAERWAFFETLDRELLADSVSFARALWKLNELPSPQVGALHYAMTHAGYGEEVLTFLTNTGSSSRAGDPAYHVAALVARLKRETNARRLPELATWQPLVVAWHSHLRGEAVRSQHAIEYHHGDTLTPLLPADLSPRRAVAASRT